MKRAVWFLLFAMTLMTGCSSLVFRSYEQSVRPLLQQLDAQPSDNAVAMLDENKLMALNHGPDQLLYWLEKGRIAQIQGDFSSSLQAFTQAMAIVDQQAARPLIDLSDLGQQSLSLAVNDKVRDYVMPADQRSFLQAFQALNYLFLHRLDSAAVEARREGQLYQQAVDRNQTAGRYVEKQVHRLHLDEGEFNKTTEAHSKSLPTPAYLPKYSFLNAYGFFVSGLAFELNHQLNDAMIEYKKALALNPSNIFIQQRLTRLNKKAQPATAEVIVIYEQGWVPSLSEARAPFVWDNHLAWLSLPGYREPWLPPSGFVLQLDQNKNVLISQPLVDVYGLAVQSLRERSGALMIRQIMRLAVKINLSARAQQQAGNVGVVLSDIYNAISEQADLRTWLSLPHSVQLASIALKPGSHTLLWRDQQTGLAQPLTLVVSAHQIYLVRVINTGHRFYVQTVAYKNTLL